MATLLARQLQTNQRRSADSLDLHKHRSRESRSILFGPKISTPRNLENAFTIGLSGFEDLCKVDTRFEQFSSNLFGVQSVRQDRSQMTAEENESLDKVLDSFLLLVSPRLLLGPAIKAVEWLVRRYRINDFNIRSTLLAFLPYFQYSVFSSVLSILPETLPSEFSFLRPYTRSLIRPKREAFVHAARHNKMFMSSLASQVLLASKRDCNYSLLMSLWVSMICEVFAREGSSTGTRRQDIEYFVTHIAPLLNEALAQTYCDDLRLAGYLILIVCLTKVNLTEQLNNAFMDAVSSAWDNTLQPGLICLISLAQHKKTTRLPKTTTHNLILTERLAQHLINASRHYNVAKLSTSLILSILNDPDNFSEPKARAIAGSIFGAGLLGASTQKIIESNFSRQTMQNLESSPSAKASYLVPQLPTSSLQDVSNSERPVTSARSASSSPAKETDESPAYEQRLRTDEVGLSPQPATGDPGSPSSFNVHLPGARLREDRSFLSFESSQDCEIIGKYFASAVSEDQIESFASLPVFESHYQKPAVSLITFLMRTWCGSPSPSLRAKALKTTRTLLLQSENACDFQGIIPYAIHGLADPALPVRQEATQMITLLAEKHSRATSEERRSHPLPIFGKSSLYGMDQPQTKLSWLSHHDTSILLDSILIPNLEESILDPECAINVLHKLSPDQSLREKHPVHKASSARLASRVAILTFITSHAIQTAVLPLKLILLSMLKRIDKLGNWVRSKELMPLVAATLDDLKTFEALSEGWVDKEEFANSVVGILAPTDTDSISYMRMLISAHDHKHPGIFRDAAHSRLCSIWPELKADAQIEFAEILLRQTGFRGAHDNSSALAIQAEDTLNKLSIPLKICKMILRPVPSLLASLSSSLSPSKRRKVSHTSHKSEDVVTVDKDHILPYFSAIIEKVMRQDLKPDDELLELLFSCLKNLSPSSITQEKAVTFAQVSLMDCILRFIRIIEASPSFTPQLSSFHTDELVDTVRTTSDPQLRKLSLLLLSELCPLAPELVVNSILPVFTFFSSSVFLYEDEYSKRVTTQTMDSIIPRLVTSIRQRRGGGLRGISRLLLNFVTAFEHVPDDRRLDTYDSLINNVGPEAYLYCFIILLIDKYKDESITRDFSIEIISRYPTEIVFRTINHCLAFALDLLSPTPQFAFSILDPHQKRPERHLVHGLLTIVSGLFGNQSIKLSLRRRFASAGDSQSDHFELHCKSFLLLLHLSRVSGLAPATHKLWQESVDGLLKMLPVAALLDIFQVVVSDSPGPYRRHFLQSYENCLNNSRDLGSHEEQATRFMDHLNEILNDDKDTALKSSALTYLEIIVETFGKRMGPKAERSMNAIIQSECLSATDDHVRVMALLCLSTLIEASGEHALPYVTLLIPVILTNLEESITSSNQGSDRRKASFSAISTIFLHLPYAMSREHLYKFFRLSLMSSHVNEHPKDREARKNAFSLLAQMTDFETQSLLLHHTWDDAVDFGPVATREHLMFLEICMEIQPKHIMSKYSQLLGNIMLTALGLRTRINSRPSPTLFNEIEVNEVEDVMIRQLLNIVYKLNDHTFRPIFIKMLTWATTNSVDTLESSEMLSSRTTFYRFLLRFFESLKSIATSYASFILDDATALLKLPISENAAQPHLQRLVMRWLIESLKHDQDGFYHSPSHCNPLLNAITNSFSLNHLDYGDIFVQFVTEFAVASDSAGTQKELNAILLQNMHSTSVQARLVAIRCQQALTARIGGEWLTMLPDMLPLISELQDDDDEQVESQTNEWLDQIESILGESIRSMLQ